MLPTPITADPAARAASARAAGSGSDSDSDADLSSDLEDAPQLTGSSADRGYDKSVFSSEMHEDVSRILGSVLGVEHNNRIAAGPLSVDICHLSSMTVVEVAAPWQYYLRSGQVTALARRRHELLRAMGFRLAHVPFHRWAALQGDDEGKADFLRRLLPAAALRPAAASAAGAEG
ncbi:unnamed protein product, partial [Prorocentrum cordatum]